MKLLLTSNGITNTSIRNGLIDLLGKPIADCNALFIPTAIYPFPFGARYAWDPIRGKANSPFCDLGWKSLGLLELTALPSIRKEVWIQAIHDTDALLVWGGDPMYLSHWLKQSGLGDLLPTLLDKMVYVGVSAGSIAVSSIFGETYSTPPAGTNDALSFENLIFKTPEGEKSIIFATAHGAGLVDFAIIPHYNHQDHPDAAMANAEIWASKLPVPVYAIDDQTAIKVVDGTIEVISAGKWQLFEPVNS